MDPVTITLKRNGPYFIAVEDADRVRIVDHEGNLIYRKTARNFNPNMATAAKVTIAEVEELVPNGSLDPDQIHTPGIFVSRIFQGTDYKKLIEFRTTRPRPDKEAV